LKRSKALSIFALIIAGEAVFLLPFILIRVFRAIIRDAFVMTDAQIGEAQAMYGITAVIAYFFGGFFADKFEPRKLLAISLIATGLGGLWMITIPSVDSLKILYGFWGVSTILLFWAALIKATRQWGNEHNQGLSFGLLDGGRGFFAATIATVGAFIPMMLFGEDTSNISQEEKVVSMQYIIGFVTFVVLLVSLFVWNILPKASEAKEEQQPMQLNLLKAFKLLLQPKILFHAIIIVCAYSAYKITDVYATYAKDVWSFNNEESSYFGAAIQWLRPFAAFFIGWIADRYVASKFILYAFGLMTVCSILIGFGVIENIPLALSMLTFFIMVIGTYSLRGLYFAIIEEAKTPIAITGTVVGIISVLGFTPDIFMSLLSGYMLGSNPTVVEYQNLFQVFTFFPLVGLLATVGFRNTISKSK
jgi:nitrate/nitrite transporter NarK